MSHRLIGRKLSHTEISQVNKELVEAVENWRNWVLSQEPIQYIFVDGVNFEMRMGDSIEKTPVLVAIGVTESGPGWSSGCRQETGNRLPTGDSFSKT